VNEKHHMKIGITVKGTPLGKPIVKGDQWEEESRYYFSRNSMVLGWGGNYRIQLEVFAF